MKVQQCKELRDYAQRQIVQHWHDVRKQKVTDDASFLLHFALLEIKIDLVDNESIPTSTTRLADSDHVTDIEEDVAVTMNLTPFDANAAANAMKEDYDENEQNAGHCGLPTPLHKVKQKSQPLNANSTLCSHRIETKLME